MIRLLEETSKDFWKKIPQTTGIYFFLDKNKNPVYIGKALNIRERLKQHIQDTANPKESAIVRSACFLKWEETLSEFEALVYEANLVWKYQPKYNSELKDDKSPIYIVITKEQFSKVRLERKTNLTGKEKLIFGPLTSAKLARHLLRVLRHIYPFCTDKTLSTKPCFYHHLGLCNPCPNEIELLKSGVQPSLKLRPASINQEVRKLTVKYQTNIRSLMKILEGSGRKLLHELEKEMQSFSDREDFEEARVVRDRIYYLERLFRGDFASTSQFEDPEFTSKQREQETHELEEVLHIERINRVECYDISNFSFDFATASMVVFIQGEPAKDHYRRFRIKGKRRFDPEMLLEVLERRFTHPEWPLPDLVVLDGGTPQVLSVYPVLKQKYPTMPPLIGIAKGPDRLLDAKSLKYLDLPYSSGALHYVQRLRDEAHRFAKKYHLLLRSANYGFQSGVKK